MAELGSGSGSGYPTALDTDITQEINSPNAARTKARAEVINDLNAAVVAVQTELGTDPAGSLTDVKTYLQTEHGTDGTHLATKVVKLTGNQTGIAGTKAWTGTQKWAKGVDVASATALTLGADGNIFHITGTTTITSIGAIGVGTLVVLLFNGVLTLTHHATDLILPAGANITTASGDIAVFYESEAGDWRCVSYTKASGEAIAGSVPDGYVTAAKLVSYAAGDAMLAAADTLGTRTTEAFVKVKEFYAEKTGVYRTYFEIRLVSGNGSGPNSSGRIYKNGLAHGTLQTTSSTSFVGYTEDLTFAAGDLIQLYCVTFFGASGSAGSMEYQNCRLKVSSPSVTYVNLNG